jgi:hypothetical protein
VTGLATELMVDSISSLPEVLRTKDSMDAGAYVGTRGPSGLCSVGESCTRRVWWMEWRRVQRWRELGPGRPTEGARETTLIQCRGRKVIELPRAWCGLPGWRSEWKAGRALTKRNGFVQFRR